MEDNLLFSICLNLFYLHYSRKLDWTKVITTLVISAITFLQECNTQLLHIMAIIKQGNFTLLYI